MGLFDFLKPQVRAKGPGGYAFSTAGMDPNTALMRQEGAGGFMKTAPQLEELDMMGRLNGALGGKKGGAGFGDRALMALLALNGDTSAAVRMKLGLREQQREQEERQRRNEALKAAYDPATGKFDRQRYAEAGGDPMDALQIARAEEALRPDPRVIANSRGIFRVGEDGEVETLQEYEPEPEGAPSGFRWNEDGTALELIPGYAEGIGKVSGVRREAVTSRPMPRATGGGRGGSGGAVPPWKRGWR